MTSCERGAVYLKPCFQAARRAHSALAGIRGGSQRTAAARIVRAIESLVPADAKTKEAYALGYKDRAEDALKKGNRDDRTPRRH